MSAARVEAARVQACPKQMVHGPCGGVRADGGCEVGGPCAFVLPAAPKDGALGADFALAAPATRLAPAPVRAADRPPRTGAASGLLAQLDRGRFVVADLPSLGPDVEAERALAATLAGSVDAVLLGDAPWARLQLPPALRAEVVAAEGVRAWAGLNCRDRNRVALRAELEALSGLGHGAVHCVTGDHPALGHRSDAPAVFDLDSTRLARSAATATGLVVSVAESPEAPPTAMRAARAAEKARAGADICFVNHASSVQVVADFAAQVRALAPSLRLIACVPLVVTQVGADRLTAFLHGPLPATLTDPLLAPDPVAAGVAACVAHAEALLAVPEIDGVDLSAPAGPGEAPQIASALAEAGRALR